MDDKERLCEKGSHLNFILTCEQSLGDVTSLLIWLDEKDKNCIGWFVDKIVVKDVFDNKR